MESAGPPAQPSPRSPSSRPAPASRSSCASASGCWHRRAGLRGSLAAGPFVFLYQTIDVPDPNEDFQTETSFVYYADGKTELGTLRHAEPRVDPARRDAAEHAGRRGRGREPSFWTDKGIDPKGIVRAAFSNARGNATQGASTITQQYVKILYLTQERSLERKVKEAILSLKLQRQLSKKEILEGYLNTIYFGRGAYGVQAASRGVLRHRRQGPQPEAERGARQRPEQPDRLRPRQRQGRQGRTSRSATTTSLAGMAKTGDDHRRARPSRPRSRLPKFPKIEAQSRVRRPEGPHAHAGPRRAAPRSASSDEEIDGGGLRVTTTFTKKAMKAAEDGVHEARPDGFSDKKLHVGVATVEPGTGALRGFYGGQDYLESQINWAVAGGRSARRSSRSRWRPRSRTATPSRTPSTATRRTSSPTALTVSNEGTGSDGLGNDYGSAVNATYALEESINTAFVDMTQQHAGRPGQDPRRRPNALGIPPEARDQDCPGIPDSTPRPRARSR